MRFVPKGALPAAALLGASTLLAAHAVRAAADPHTQQTAACLGEQACAPGPERLSARQAPQVHAAGPTFR